MAVQSLSARDTPESEAHRNDLVRELGRAHVDARVLSVMAALPRHVFVPDAPISRAYENQPVPIGFGQTISQPAVVAQMTAALELTGTERVLEIGTGSGYQAAILAMLAAEVFTLEVIPEHAREAAARFVELGLANVRSRTGDGYAGWPEEAPFERIIVTAAPIEVPRSLLGQLAEGGVLVAPAGRQGETQRLLRYRKSERGELSVCDLGAVIFVPMIHGAHE